MSYSPNFVFDINAAGQLISEMDTYSQNVQKSAVEILDILELSDRWNDNNSKEFIANNKRICEDLIKIVETEEEYKNAYLERINELTGQYI